MRHKFLKELVLFCVMVMIASTTVFSSGTLVYGAVNGKSLYEDVTEISDKSTILTRGNYLNYGAVTLTKLDSIDRKSVV